MKKVLLNVVLVLVLLAGLVIVCITDTMAWVAGFLPMYLAALGLLKLNTDYIEKY